MVDFGGGICIGMFMTHAFYDLPVLSSKDIVTVTGLSQGTVDNTLKRLHENHIVREVTGYSRNRIFVLYDYLEILMIK